MLLYHEVGLVACHSSKGQNIAKAQTITHITKMKAHMFFLEN